MKSQNNHKGHQGSVSGTGSSVDRFDRAESQKNWKKNHKARSRSMNKNTNSKNNTNSEKQQEFPTSTSPFFSNQLLNENQENLDPIGNTKDFSDQGGSIKHKDAASASPEKKGSELKSTPLDLFKAGSYQDSHEGDNYQHEKSTSEEVVNTNDDQGKKESKQESENEPTESKNEDGTSVEEVKDSPNQESTEENNDLDPKVDQQSDWINLDLNKGIYFISLLALIIPMVIGFYVIFRYLVRKIKSLFRNNN